MSSLHFPEYHTKFKHARHDGFQTPDVEHRTDSRRPLDQPPGTTGTDEDGDSWRRRRAKTETDEDGDSRRRRQTHSGDERSGSSLTADDTPEWRRRNLILLLSCNPLTPEPMKDAACLCSPRSSRGTALVLSFLNLFSGKRWLWSVDSPLRLCQLVWQKTNYKTFGTTVLTERRLVFFVPDSPLCPKHTFFFVCSVKSQHTWLADHIKQTVNTVLVGQSFHNVPSHNITFPSVKKTDSSWIVQHDINDEHFFVTTVDWTVARLSAITVNLYRPLMVTHTLETVGN